ncbi:MAG TPA: hypothetical protein VLQ93_10310, partial [Myxococcaceae bacterium]|nr:hypothetical protein [Myxococcaceae bacterium]
MHSPRLHELLFPDVPAPLVRPGSVLAGVGLLLAVLTAAPVFAAGEVAVPPPGLELSHVDRL